MSSSNATGETSEVVGEYLDTSSPTSFRLEVERLDTRPFSESFSIFLGSDDTGEDLSIATITKPMSTPQVQDMSYDIERLTNVKAIAPEWDDDVDEIVIMSPKPKYAITPEVTFNKLLDSNPKVHGLANFEILYDLSDKGKTRTTLVRSSISGKLCVLKRLRKISAQNEDSVPHIWSEQVILETLRLKSIPFIVNLQTSFEDQDYYNLVMDYYPGGDLLSFIARDGPFSPDRVLSYSSEIVTGIAALHALKIIHHNLTAENVMIDLQGRIVLTGFGRAEDRSVETSPNRTHSLHDLGESQPPELILGWKHDFTVDCWGFGILLFMMQVGRHPFSNSQDSHNQDVIRHNIIRGPIPFHTLADVSFAARDLVMKCLERNPALRFNVQQIRAHEYFSEIKWMDFVVQAEPDTILPSRGVHRSPSITGKFPSSNLKDGMRTPSLHSATGTEPSAARCMIDARPSMKPILSQRTTNWPEIRSQEGSTVAEIGQDTVLDIKALDGLPHETSTVEESYPISGENSGSDCGSFSRADVDGLPRRLRKKASSVVPGFQLSTTGTAVSSTKTSGKLRKKFRSMQTFTCSPERCLVEMPKGVEQHGKGIGFTFTLPAANHSSLTVCSTAPDSCYGFLWRGLSFRHRKTARPAIAKIPSSGNDIQEEIIADQRHDEVYSFARNPFPGGISPFLLSSPFSHTAVNSPSSAATSSMYGNDVVALRCTSKSEIRVPDASHLIL